MTCHHQEIVTISDVESGDPVMWMCWDCRLKFLPITQALAEVEAEREACAKVVLRIANDDAGNPYKQALRMGAEAIRARGSP